MINQPYKVPAELLNIALSLGKCYMVFIDYIWLQEMEPAE